jgi:adenine-specific DNA-methyltransferase
VAQSNKQRLELTWIGKENRPRLEPRILLEDQEKSYHAKKRVTENDIFDNRLIFGDNLLALKALEQEFAGKVKCVYIDPPYNTGSAFTHYDDGVEHSIWLSLMRDRLEILKRLLRPDGVLFCSLDVNELFYAGALFDEVFGRENRIEVFVWKKSYGGGAKSNYVVNQSEFVLCYAKQLDILPKFLLPPDEKVLKYYKYEDEHLLIRGPYRLQPLATTSNDERPNLRYSISYMGQEIWPEKQWQWSQECQGRSKTRPVGRSKSRPVVGGQIVEYSGEEGRWSVAEAALLPRGASRGEVQRSEDGERFRRLCLRR